MKIIKIVLMILIFCNIGHIFSQEYVAKFTIPRRITIGYTIEFIDYKILNGNTVLNSFNTRIENSSEELNVVLTSRRPITSVQIEYSRRRLDPVFPAGCSITETVSISGNNQNCFHRSFRGNGLEFCWIDLLVTRPNSLLNQPINDTFCPDDVFSYNGVNCSYDNPLNSPISLYDNRITYEWFYNINNSGTFLPTNVTTSGNEAVRIPFNRILPRNYRGSIRLRARATIGNRKFNTNIVVFRTLPCAPEISRVTPINASCGRSNGGLTITFGERVDQEMLFVIRENGRPVESVQQYVAGSSFTWPTDKGLRSGTYTLTYQPFPGETINYPRPITIGDTPKIVFSAVKTADVQCFGEKTGSATITARNGNGRYQYRVNGGRWLNFSSGNTHFLSGLAGRQNYRIEVQDTSGCMGETASGNVGENVFINGPRDGVTFINVRIRDITYRGDNTGAISLTVTGGTRPYTYQWSNGSITEDISDLSAGFYTLVVTDSNNCRFTSERFEVTEPDALQVGIDVKQVISCNDNINGHLEAIPSGGIPADGYQYQWTKVGDPTFDRRTKSINNLTPGTYNVTLSNIGAPSTSANEELINPDPLALTPIQTEDVQCFGESTGSIRFTISGGRPPYTIIWDNGTNQTSNGPVALVNIPKGNYNFQVFDIENCPINNTAPIVITEEDEIVIDVEGLGIQGPTTVNGTNGALDITVSGGTGIGTYRYAWTSDQFTGTRTTEDLSGLTEGTYTLNVLDANDCPKTRVFELKDPEPLVVSIKIDNDLLCFGQKVNLSAIATGGVTNSAQTYSYQWYVIKSGVPEELTGETNQTITGLEEGIYEVKVNDILDASTTSDREEFIEPSEILLDGTHENILCHGGNNGSIDITASGGIPPLTFEWVKLEDPTFQSITEDLNDITFGTYTVSVRDANLVCVKKKTFVVEQPENPVTIVDFDKQNVKIFGESTGSISITVSGGTPNYSYRWTMQEDNTFLSLEKDITALKVGNYTVEIMDANASNITPNQGCITTQDFEITQPDKLEVTITIGAALDCFGFSDGILDANAFGGIENEPYTYRWFEIIDSNETEITDDLSEAFKANLKKGTYKVLVEDVNGAKATDIFEFKEPEKIVASFIEKKDVICFEETNGSIRYTITGGTPFDDNTYIVELNRNGNFYTIGSYQTGELKFDALPAGTYEIIVQDKNGCPALEFPDPVEIKQPDKLQVSDVELTNLTGFETQNGSITVTVSGGTPEYRYEWRRQNETDIIGRERTLNELPIGNYEITIFDTNDCEFKTVYTLEQPDPLIVTIDYPNIGGRVSCNGFKDAILEATVTGGVPFDNDTANPYYQYRWYSIAEPTITLGDENELQNIGIGEYQLTVVDANGNTSASLSFEVIEPTPIEINITNKNDVDCFNEATGSITIEASGGTPFDNGEYAYTWSNGASTTDISNLYAGDYTITITDKNNCKTSRTITIDEPSPLTINQITRIPPSSLNSRDGSVSVSVINGTPPYSYQWFDQNDVQLQIPSSTSILQNIGSEPYFVTVTDAKGCMVNKINVDNPLPDLMVEIVQVNPVLCLGSNTAGLRANVTGGIPFTGNNPYIHTWYEEGNPSPIGSGRVIYELPIGSYYVIVEDMSGSNITSLTYRVTGPPLELEVTLSTDFVNCGDQNDWSIYPTVTGGVPPYRYFWKSGLGNNTELTNMPPGTYTVQIQDARGCIAQRSITTPELIPLEAKISGINPKCYKGSNGSAVVTPSGGVPPYTYFWNTNNTTSEIIDVTAGDYFVEITDSKGCRIIKEITLLDPEEIVIDIGPTSKILCLGQTYTVNATINDPNATYKWTSDKGFESSNPEVVLSEEATYQIEVITSDQCIVNGNLDIIVRDSPLNAEFLLSSDVFVNETFVLANVSYPKPDAVEWKLPEGAQIIEIDDTYAEVQFNTPGEYDVELLVFLDGCQDSFSESIVVRERSSLAGNSTVNFLRKFTVYPIPNNRVFTIEAEFKETTPISFNIYSIANNAPILSNDYRDEGSSTYTIPMDLQGQNLPPGVYFIILETSEKRYVHKIVIE